MIDLAAILDGGRFVSGAIAIFVLARWGSTAWRAWWAGHNGTLNWLVWCVVIWALADAFVGWVQFLMSVAGYPPGADQLTLIKIAYYTITVTAKCCIAGASSHGAASVRRSAIFCTLAVLMWVGIAVVMYG